MVGKYGGFIEDIGSIYVYVTCGCYMLTWGKVVILVVVTQFFFGENGYFLVLL